MKSKKVKAERKGSALLVVLLIVMAITILSLGFLSRSDVELACGENMILRTQMDYLVESGLEHARGLILNDSNYLGNWAITGQQLVDSSGDFYDVDVVKDANGECNYQISCDAYRETNGERVGCSSLEAELRLDPCIALWIQGSTIILPGFTINGDVYCSGGLANSGIIDGDVFANSLSGGGSVTGQQKTTGDLSLTWPQIAVGNYSPDQTIEDSNLSSVSYTGIVYCPNDIELLSGVNIEGMLIVDGNLTITGSGNVITAGEDLPAMLVTGNLTISTGGGLDVYGLVVVNGRAQIYGDTDTDITGGLFVGNRITDSGGNMTITAAPSKAAITHWPSGNPARWSPAVGAFFKSIERK